MNFEETVLDIECLDNDLPPMSKSSESISNFIRTLEPRQRRAVNRKIKKLCKRFIALSLSKKGLSATEKSEKSKILKSRLGFNSSTTLFNSVRVHRNRIDFVKSFLRIQAKKKFD